MDQLSESLWHDFLLLGERELKYDGHNKKCRKNDEVLEGGANLWFWNTRVNTYTGIFQGYAVSPFFVCNCPHPFNTHTENS